MVLEYDVQTLWWYAYMCPYSYGKPTRKHKLNIDTVYTVPSESTGTAKAIFFLFLLYTEDIWVKEQKMNETIDQNLTFYIKINIKYCFGPNNVFTKFIIH